VIVLLVVGAIILALTNTRQAILDSGNTLPEEVAHPVREPA
jgi:hypothetical protein